MEREYRDDLVELGVVSADTRGSASGKEDLEIGERFVGGLTDD